MGLNLFTLGAKALPKHSNGIHNFFPRSEQHQMSTFGFMQNLQINVLHCYIEQFRGYDVAWKKWKLF